jgi:hypothetical protein
MKGLTGLFDGIKMINPDYPFLEASNYPAANPVKSGNFGEVYATCKMMTKSVRSSSKTRYTQLSDILFHPKQV